MRYDTTDELFIQYEYPVAERIALAKITTPASYPCWVGYSLSGSEDDFTFVCNNAGSAVEVSTLASARANPFTTVVGGTLLIQSPVIRQARTARLYVGAHAASSKVISALKFKNILIADEILAGFVKAEYIDVDYLSALTSYMGTLTSGSIIAGSQGNARVEIYATDTVGEIVGYDSTNIPRIRMTDRYEIFDETGSLAGSIYSDTADTASSVIQQTDGDSWTNFGRSTAGYARGIAQQFTVGASSFTLSHLRLYFKADAARADKSAEISLWTDSASAPDAQVAGTTTKVLSINTAATYYSIPFENVTLTANTKYWIRVEASNYVTVSGQYLYWNAMTGNPYAGIHKLNTDAGFGANTGSDAWFGVFKRIDTPIMVIDAAKILLKDRDDYRAAAYASAGTSVNNATYTKIGFQAEEYDPSADYDPALSRYTCPTAGRYRVTATVSFGGVSSGEQIWVMLYQNGAKVKSGNRSTNAVNSFTQVTATLDCTAGDYLEVFAYCAFASARTTNTGSDDTWIEIQKVN